MVTPPKTPAGQPRPYRILIEAFSSNNRKGSEPHLGYKWIELFVAAGHEVYVITRAKAELPSGIRQRWDVAAPFDGLRDFLKRFNRVPFVLEFVNYKLWLFRAYRKSKAILKQQPCDFVLHATYGNISLGTYQHRHRLPLVFCGGGVTHIPPALRKYRSLLDVAREFYEKHLTVGFLKSQPLLLVPTANTRAWLQSKGLTLANEIVPDGFPMGELSVKNLEAQSWPKNRARPLRFVYVNTYRNKRRGRQILSQAWRHCSLTNSELHIFGYPLNPGGPPTINRGFLKGEEFRQALLDMDCFLSPSYREGASTSLIEALLAGLPIVCFQNVGVAELLPKSASWLVESRSGDAVENFAQVLTDIDAGRIVFSPNPRDINDFVTNYYGAGRTVLVHEAITKFLPAR